MKLKRWEIAAISGFFCLTLGLPLRWSYLMARPYFRGVAQYDSEIPSGLDRIATDLQLLMIDDWDAHGVLPSDYSQIQKRYEAKKTFFHTSLAPGARLKWEFLPDVPLDPTASRQKRTVKVTVWSSLGEWSSTDFELDLERPAPR